MPGRYIEDAIDEKQAELDALDHHAARIMGRSQMAYILARKADVQRELAVLKQKLATGPGNDGGDLRRLR
jgi:hypothetical protein